MFQYFVDTLLKGGVTEFTGEKRRVEPIPEGAQLEAILKKGLAY